MVEHWVATQLIMQTTIAAAAVGGHAGRCQQLVRVGPGVEKVECRGKYFRILRITTDFALVSGGGAVNSRTKIGVMGNSLDGWGWVFVYKLITEKDFGKRNTNSFVSPWAKRQGEKKRERRERETEWKTTWQQWRETLCEGLIVVSDWTGRPVISTLQCNAAWRSRKCWAADSAVIKPAPPKMFLIQLFIVLLVEDLILFSFGTFQMFF